MLYAYLFWCIIICARIQTEYLPPKNVLEAIHTYISQNPDFFTKKDNKESNEKQSSRLYSTTPLKLVSSDSEHNHLTAESHSITNIRVNDFVSLPKYDIQTVTTEGHNCAIHSEQIVDYLAFKKEWLDMSLNVRNDCLALITIKDDSMEPTLRSDDLILTDVRRSHLENNSLYVLQLDNELVVKRIQRKLNGSLIVKSDNPNYESEELDELAAKSLHIIGKVIWFGRRI
ncbi:S24 family peptidase [Nitrosomonas ureae]|uniref:Peptidase S24-like n=1 Tax=Nitrosomonas ureae TaxID=44577 RepID=A0A1H2HQC4_9PROT|nr:S24 family peptidase [Nitrosomonas ureae]ALQ51851.1 hypothetical protein ATY38_11865 [Nitrosomonas ureae]SDU34090.1 Peptidase S24-like [Nitrosomonas ureae]